jgi:phosphate transport system substrate-binding protein
MRTAGLAIILAFAALVPAFEARAESLTYIGCSIVRLSFMARMIDTFQKKTGISVNAIDGGDAAAIKAVNGEPGRFGGVCRELFKTPDEENLRLVLVGWGALVIVVNARNPIRYLSIDQVRKVFDGTMRNWKDIGGRDLEIHPVVRKPGKFSGVGYSTRLLIYGDTDHVYGDNVIPVAATAEVEDVVARDESAIGFSDVMSAKKNPGIAVLPLENIIPDKASIATGRYSLFRPLFLVVRKEYAVSNPSIQKFIDFVLSPEGQAIVSEEGVVNLREGVSLKSRYRWMNRGAVLNMNAPLP